MRSLSWLGAAIVIACLLTACGDAASDTSSGGGGALDLNGRTFAGDDVTRNGDDYPLVNGSTITVSFDDKGVAGSAGCNHMGAPARWDAGVLKLDGGLAMTEMGCAEPLMNQDTWLADFLASAPELSLNHDVLTLSGENTVITLTEQSSS